jgi:hypothetical protein
MQSKLKNLVFRNIRNVNFSELKNIFLYSFLEGKEQKQEISYSEYLNLSNEDREKVGFWNHRFSGDTYGTSMRDSVEKGFGDIYAGESIHFSSDNFHRFDVENLTFKWIKEENLEAPILSNGECSGDMICGEVERDGNGKPHFMRWFNCSHQFLRMWTLTMYDDHESFRTKALCGGNGKVVHEENMYRRLFSGNRLCTAHYLKSPEESFKHSRTEPESRQWMHIYAAIVLVMRYNRLPTSDPSDNNIPVTHVAEKDKDGKIVTRPVQSAKEWNIPCGFVEKLLELVKMNL